MERARNHLPLAAILLIATIVRFSGIGFGLPHTWARPDEHALIVPAVHVVQGEFNPHWFTYPSLYMYALSPFYAAYYAEQRVRGGIASRTDFYQLYLTFPESFYLIDRWLVSTLGVLTVVVLHRTTRRLFGSTSAHVAALFLSLAPLHARDSHFGVADVPATFMVVLAFDAIVVWSLRPTIARIAWAGVLCGLAASTKYNAALIVVPAIAARLGMLRDRLTETHAIRAELTSLVCDMGVLAACASLAFIAGTPYAVLDSHAFLGDLRNVGQHLGAGHGLDLGIGWIYHLRATLRYGLGLPLLVVGLAGMAWMIRERPRTAAIVVCFPIAYYIVAGATRLVFFRYMLPILPFLCLAAAYGVGRLAAALTGRFSSSFAMPAAVAALSLVLVGYQSLDVVGLDLRLRRTDTRVLASSWLRSNFPPTSTVYQTGAFYGHLEYGRSPAFRETTLVPGGTFMLDGQTMERPPDLIVVQSSPLMYSSDVPLIDEITRRDYDRVASFVGHDPAKAAGQIYDPIDAFYLPLRGFDGVERPGPNISIYRRR